MVNAVKEKAIAGEKAAELIKNNQIVGVGSGTTVSYFIKSLGKRIKEEGLVVKTVPSSYQVYLELVDAGVPTTTLDEYPLLDITVDGADEVDENLNLIKGGGAALTREKIIGTYTKKLVIIVDSSKYVKKLGKFPLPIEVLPMALKPVTSKLKEMGGKPQCRIGAKKMGPVVTDNGNFIIDCEFNVIEEPGDLEKKLNMLPGVIENGLFVNLTDMVIIGSGEKTVIKEK
ncbi:MAG: ribose-5-phosphate isomerase RpiA [Candidatus Odinarchaeia archaeon]